MSSNALSHKFDQLDPQAQDQLLAFCDFLLARSSGSATAMSEAYRKQIRQVGVWSEDDLKALKEAASRWQWQIPEW